MSKEKLAVVGIGCRFPGGADDRESFWNLLEKGANEISDVPEDRWIRDNLYDPDTSKSGKIKNQKGGFIEGIDKFDAEFFNIFPAEASRMDPQQRLLLEVTHESMEDAGIPIEKFSGSKTGVFVGGFLFDYLCMQHSSEMRDKINSFVAMGTDAAALSNRISYVYDLKGPSLTIDTACSSSLVSLHYACQSVLNDECDMAVAAGVNAILRPEGSIVLSKGGFLNTDGYCKSFDSSANGYVRAEGCGVILIKKLNDALRDKNKIYGVIRGSAVNQDGTVSSGFTVPSVSAQKELLKTAYSNSGVDPSDVTYIEAHGTGTAVGDPIEANALGEIVGLAKNRKSPLKIGSVKSNMGHMEGASGIAGAIKALLVLQNQAIPPNVNFNTPNPNIDFDGLKLDVPVSCEKMSGGSEPMIVGVNSFGAGGTNAHLVLEEYTRGESREKPKCSEAEVDLPIIISSKSQEGLNALAKEYERFFGRASSEVQEVASSLMRHRSRYSHSLVVAAKDAMEAQERLAMYSEGITDQGYRQVNADRVKKPKVAFMFSGQGGQWLGMGRKLYETDSTYRSIVDEIDGHFEDIAGWSIASEMFGGEDENSINKTNIVQPAIMITQVATAEILIRKGVNPDGVVGHSIGEVAAAYMSGAISLKEAVYVIYHRSNLQNKLSGKGAMLAVGVGLEEANDLVEQFGENVSIAAINSPTLVVLAGDNNDLLAIEEVLIKEEKFCRFVNVEVPYHSHYMQEIREELIDVLQKVQGKPSTIPLYSTVEGCLKGGAHLSGEYWYENVRKPVLFTKTIECMCEDGYDLFIEVGPHPVLVAGCNDVIKERSFEAHSTFTLRKNEDEVDMINLTLGEYFCRGGDLELANEDVYDDGLFAQLPKQVWQHKRYWFETNKYRELRLGKETHQFLAENVKHNADPNISIWNTNISTANFPFLKDHQVGEEVVFPATGHLEVVQAVAAAAYGNNVVLENISFESALLLSNDVNDETDVRLEISSSEGHFTVCSSSPEGEVGEWKRHSTGVINHLDRGFVEKELDFASEKRKFTDEYKVDISNFYESLRNAGINYGHSFQCVKDVWVKDSDLLAKVELPANLDFENKKFNSHPALLDAALHSTFIHLQSSGYENAVYLPSYIKKVKFFEKHPSCVWVHTKISSFDSKYFECETLVFDEDGVKLAEIQGLRCKALDQAGDDDDEKVYDGCYGHSWYNREINLDKDSPNIFIKKSIIITESGSLYSNLKEKFLHFGIPVELVDTSVASQHQQIEHELLDKLSGYEADEEVVIVYASSPSSDNNFSTWDQTVEAGQVSRNASNLLALFKVLQKLQLKTRLAVLTFNSNLIPGIDKTVDLDDAPLIGMVRVFRNETPEVETKCIDLSAIPSGDELTAFLREIVSPAIGAQESEVAFRGSGRYVRVLNPVIKESLEKRLTTELKAKGGKYRAELTSPGIIENLKYRQHVIPSIGTDEVEIDVIATGVNYKDVVNVMGVLAKEAVTGGLAGDHLGLEVAGTIRKCGANVSDFTVGDEVIARVSDGYSGKVVANQQYVFTKPDRLSMCEAATIPVVFLTAHYALNHLASLEEGEVVLIHSGSGGVGGAAIQLAKSKNAKIIATAGTEEKRDYLRSLGIEYVFDSRSLAFYTQIMEVTGNRGVDVVLNSLTGEALVQSIKCLAPFGRFVEIGKHDIYENSKINMERLGENISYFVVDVDRLATQKPKLHQKLMREVVEYFNSQELSPLNLTVYEPSQIHKALRELSRGDTIGKVVIDNEEASIRALPASHLVCESNSSYLITGGTSGFGLELANFLVSRGARRLVLVSRSGVKSDKDAMCVEKMRGQGVEVIVEKLDISKYEVVNELVGHINNSEYPLRGIIHAAGVLSDASIANMDEANFAKVFSPKALGAWNFHRATIAHDIELDMFVMLSSISSVLGLYGQVNYAAANYFLDTLATFRQAQGSKGISANLGVLGEYAGMSRLTDDSRHVMELLTSHGMPPIALNDILQKLELAIVQNVDGRMMANFDWKRFVNAYPEVGADSRFEESIKSSLSANSNKLSTGFVGTLLGLEIDEQSSYLATNLAKAIGEILDVSSDKINVNKSLSKLSLDSMSLNHFRNWILRNLDINYPIMKLIKGPSLMELSDDLILQIRPLDSDSDSGESNEKNVSLSEKEIEAAEA